ncbi:Cullin binding-domain-containing protein [Chytriomyces sp. MP71]|nr:Cullin binding-domain-containing protein [Chytriomyces sp. MP71]
MQRMKGWKLDAACDAFFSDGNRASNAAQTHASSAKPAKPSKRIDAAKLNKLFDKYKEQDEDIIGLEGTEKLCEDLNVDPMDVVALILAFHLKCERMWLDQAAVEYQFREDEDEEKRQTDRCETLEDMQSACVAMRSDLDDPITFRDIYNFTFNFARQDNQKSLALETAVAFWQLLFMDRYTHIALWLEFLEDHKNSISKDTWVQFLDFTKKYPDSFDGYEDDGAWPLLIDEFVEFAQEKLE